MKCLKGLWISLHLLIWTQCISKSWRPTDNGPKMSKSWRTTNNGLNICEASRLKSPYGTDLWWKFSILGFNLEFELVIYLDIYLILLLMQLPFQQPKHVLISLRDLGDKLFIVLALVSTFIAQISRKILYKCA